MMRKLKHSLEYFTNKSLNKKTSPAEEDVLDSFAKAAYQVASWHEDKMGSSKIVRQTIYENILHKTERKSSWKSYAMYAAAASIVVLLGLSFYNSTSTISEEQKLFTTSNSSQSIQLSDGSIIHLSAHSTLQYPVKFTATERKVSLLKGNAFFEVAKDSVHPFIISSGAIKTKVIGTSFHIQLAKTKCIVMVRTGKVEVSTKNQSVQLTPNQEAIFSNNALSKKTMEAIFATNWYAENITINQMSLHKVIELIEYKYGVTFQYIKGVNGEGPLTVFIAKDASLESVLQQINYITNLKFSVYGETVKVE
ncbi:MULTISPECIES: FecR family protein [Flavobacterium]|jgi:transmembrane sensor|uniref:FecR family protein n=1 Tax=Flavobacterium frigidarium TaxID=99286 RepID=A0ABV4KH75_9FLAO|nr:FecR family protein [Flavobacterium sp.]MDG2431445.1 FecR family protein [Flavobacterium sp.]